MDSDAPAQIKLLFEYTKFHIGLYASLIAALMGLMKLGAQRVPTKLEPYLKFTVICFVLAGAAGGVIGSTISVDYMALVRRDPIGFFGLNLMHYTSWVFIEHLCFWLGIAASTLGFLTKCES